MARTIQNFSTGSTIINACVPNSASGRVVWLGFSTPITSSGCVVFYRNSSSVSGSEIGTFNASPGMQVLLPFAFRSPNGIYIGASGGSGLAWVE